MELGFETIGNATLVAHDAGPVLVTDPWLVGSAYFGSWTRSHEIPERQRDAIARCTCVWLSHGHPDHLSVESLEPLKEKRILLPDHVGGRVRDDLVGLGFRVEVLPDRRWVQLSPRIRVQCLPDYNQDAVLLVEIGGRLVANLNDASDRGWGGVVRRELRAHRESYLLALSGYGDADMINFFDESGTRVPPHAAKRIPVGRTLTRLVDLYGARFFVPFSSMHRYQRADSVWANAYVTPLEAHGVGFESRTCELLPAFIRRDFARDALEQIDPPEASIRPRDPKEFGDDWSETLSADERREVEAYFRAVEHLGEAFGFVTFRVGGEETRIELDRRRRDLGITFEVPRGSLLAAVRYQVFDDLLIGNFMKTTLHGDLAAPGLYPDFSPFVAKYGDNGRARTRAELRRYFAAYLRRDPIGYLRARLNAGYVLPLQERVSRVLRERVGVRSPVFRAAKEAYWVARRLAG
jgi:hypothetical protein